MQTVDISVLERKHQMYVRYVIIHSLISRLKQRISRFYIDEEKKPCPIPSAIKEQMG